MRGGLGVCVHGLLPLLAVGRPGTASRGSEACTSRGSDACMMTCMASRVSDACTRRVPQSGASRIKQARQTGEMPAGGRASLPLLAMGLRGVPSARFASHLLVGTCRWKAKHAGWEAKRAFPTHEKRSAPGGKRRRMRGKLRSHYRSESVGVSEERTTGTCQHIGNGLRMGLAPQSLSLLSHSVCRVYSSPSPHSRRTISHAFVWTQAAGGQGL